MRDDAPRAGGRPDLEVRSMLVHNRWVQLFSGVALSIALAACGDSGGSGGSSGGGTGGTGTGGAGTGGMATGGTGTGGAATGGTGGSGGAPIALAEQGIVLNDCAPNDGPAIAARIGTPSVCGDTPNATPQVWFLAYPAQTGTLAIGDQWDFGGGSVGNLSATFWPDGSVGGQTSPTAGHLQVKDIANADQVVFEYSFTTADGAHYAGTATIAICASQPLCG